MISDFNFIVTIAPLNTGDYFATINNQAPYPNPAANPMDLGSYFDLLSGELNNSIINLGIKSRLNFTINSRVENAFQQDTASDSGSNTPGGSSSLLSQLESFTKDLEGRPVQVQCVNPDGTIDIVYVGYVSINPGSISAQNGTQFQLTCRTVLGQLGILASNNSWDQATQTYGNVFSLLNANTIDYNTLLTVIRQGSLSQDSNLIINDGAANPVPSTVWATIVPNKDKLSVLREVLLPYSRIIYQQDNGDIYVQPLFVDDTADPIFTVNCFNNYQNTWIGFNSQNAAAEIPNRVDVIFGANLPYDPFGDPNADSNTDIFATTPKINISTNQIVPLGVSGVLDYSTVYSTSTRLYNSGKYIMPLMVNLGIDNSLLLNAPLLNSLSQMYKSKDFAYSNVYVSGVGQFNSLALLYSQIYMAQINVENYNATITYDYNKVYQADSPLAQIVSIYNADNIDYFQMVCVNTTLSFGEADGTNFTINTAPLLSITGIWSSVNAE